MNLGHILFSPHGRISQNEYWLGMLIVVLANLFLTPLPFIGGLVFLGLIYVGAVIPAKRLHDADKTGWIHLIPWAISLSLLGFGVVAAGECARLRCREVERVPLVRVPAEGEERFAPLLGCRGWCAAWRVKSGEGRGKVVDVDLAGLRPGGADVW